MKIAGNLLPLLLGAGLVVAGVWYFKRNAGQIGGAVIRAADGAVGETVNTVGDVVGIPRTNISQCEADKAAGRTWDASFSCPAGDFLKYLAS